jgi:hypothetical protein
MIETNEVFTLIFAVSAKYSLQSPITVSYKRSADLLRRYAISNELLALFVVVKTFRMWKLAYIMPSSAVALSVDRSTVVSC